MKQIVTLFAMGVLCLCTTSSHAQFFQNFENAASLSSNCWSFVNFFQTTAPGEVISGTASLYSNPPTTGSSTRDVYTPFLDITSTSFTVSFRYKLNAPLSGQAMRTIQVGLADVNGTFTLLRTVTMDRNTSNQTGTNLFLRTFSLATTGVRKLVLRFGGSQGDGNTRMIVDDLAATATAHYGPSSNCNGAPVVANNTYTALSNTAVYSGASVLNNDSDPNGETLTATLATPSPDGTVLMNGDGTFTFTPNPGFTGSFTTFTYTVSDNGYTPLTGTASVYIYFPQVTTLPLQLLQFSGAVAAKTALAWKVASNETGLLFEVQRSKGSAYQSIATVFTTEKAGDETYQFADVAAKEQTSYRLKMVNKDGTITYSNVISFAVVAAEKLVLLQNPVQNTVRFTVPKATSINRIAIYNNAGMVVYSEKGNAQKSTTITTLPLKANLPQGTYLLEVMTPSGRHSTWFVKR